MFFLGFAMRDDDEPFLCQQTLRSRLEKWIRIRTDIQQAEKGTRKQQQKRKLFYKVLKKALPLALLAALPHQRDKRAGLMFFWLRIRFLS